jgi:hypothetical protein
MLYFSDRSSSFGLSKIFFSSCVNLWKGKENNGSEEYVLQRKISKWMSDEKRKYEKNVRRI